MRDHPKPRSVWSEIKYQRCGGKYFGQEMGLKHSEESVEPNSPHIESDGDKGDDLINGTFTFEHPDESWLWKQKSTFFIDPTKEGYSDNELLPKTTGFNWNKPRLGWEESMLKVGQTVVFCRNDQQCGFKGKIFIENISENFLTYRVASSFVDKFRYFPEDIGWIGPRMRAEVLIQTNRQLVSNIEDVLTETFYVHCVQIVSKDHLNMIALDILWKAFGTEMFPEYLTEEYISNNVVAADDSHFEHLSLVGRLPLYNFPFSEKEIKQIEESHSTISERVFYAHWPMKEDPRDIELQQQKRANELEKIIKVVEERSHTLHQKIRVFMAGILLTAVIILGTIYTQDDICAKIVELFK